MKALLLFLLFLPSMVSAQGEGNISLSFITLNEITVSPLYIKTGKKMEPLLLRNNRKSLPHKVSGLSALQLFTDNPSREKDAPPYFLLGEAKLVSGTSTMLYFLRETPEKKIQAFGIDDSRSKFPKSSYRFINFINAPIVVEFNKKKIGLKPRQDKVMKLNLSEKGEFTPFIVYDKDGELLGGSRLFSHANNREMVLFFPPKKGKKRLDLRFFSD